MVEFAVTDGGIIEARISPGDGLLELALNDAIGSRAPMGADRQGLSTYWIDRAESALGLAIAGGLTEPFAAGNVTYFRLDGERVVVAYEFDPEEEEAVSLAVSELLEILHAWRLRVIEAGGASAADATRGVPTRRARPMGPC